MVNLTKVLEEFDAYAVSSIGVPYEARTQVKPRSFLRSLEEKNPTNVFAGG